MVTELKLGSTEGDFRNEMDNLMREDLAQHAKGVKDEIAVKGEAGGKILPVQPVQPGKAREMGLDADSTLDLHQIMAQTWGLEYVNLDDYPVTDYKVIRMVSPDLARTYRVFPLQFDATTNTLTLAISDPANVTVVDDLSVALGCSIHPVVAKEQDIVDRINQRYGVGDESIETLLSENVVEDENVLMDDSAGFVQLSDDPTELAQSPPIKKLATLILLKAIRERASDIHIEPFETMLRIRYRVDGVLREMNSPPPTMSLGLASRLKVMASLDIAETRRPQSGRIKLLLPGDRECDLRVECVPTAHGESISMRVLDKAIMAIGIHDLGMSQEILTDFMKQIRKPNGIILVSGPTGCGKTTTLYAAIREKQTPEDKLITTEDPVEYELEGIVQINVNEAFGLTFAKCLRSILRQDPDCILVGEIRDLETAQISIQAALTGHLVFSTLHTNSAAGTITRLIDMGIEPFLITSTLQAVIGQRLIRTICPNCRTPYTPNEEELLDFGLTLEEVSDITFYHGAGCEECHYTGYKGRMGLFEMLQINEDIINVVLESGTTDDLHALALKQGMVSLRKDGWLKICQGVTTLSEVAAHTPKENIILDEDKEEKDVPPAPAPINVVKAPVRSVGGGLTPATEAAMPVKEDNLPGLV